MRSTSSGMQQQFFLAGAGAVDVDGRPDALVDQPAVEVQLHVAGALELLEDHFVHAASRCRSARWPGWSGCRLPRRCGRRRRSASASAWRWSRDRRRAACRPTGASVLWARARRVIESSRMTTSLPSSTMRLAFSSTMSLTWMCSLGGSSNVLATTSAFGAGDRAQPCRSLLRAARRRAAR